MSLNPLSIRLSKEINVSKPILIEWNREFEKEIAHRQFLAAEELLERYDLMRMARLERFTTLLNSALCELKKRNLELLSAKELLDLIRAAYQKNLLKLCH